MRKYDENEVFSKLKTLTANESEFLSQAGQSIHYLFHPVVEPAVPWYNKFIRCDETNSDSFTADLDPTSYLINLIINWALGERENL